MMGREQTNAEIAGVLTSVIINVWSEGERPDKNAVRQTSGEIGTLGLNTMPIEDFNRIWATAMNASKLIAASLDLRIPRDTDMMAGAA